jgi:hypothetical protein
MARVGFNQDYSCATVADRDGFCIYNLDPVEVSE